MKKLLSFIKKRRKILITLVVVFGLSVALYFFFTEPYHKLSTYIMHNFKEVEHRSLDIRQNYSDENGTIYEIHNKENTDFKILQLTDLHLGGSRASYNEDVKALNAVYKLINYTKPDFIVITGDMLFVSFLSRNINNMSAAVDLKNFMDNVGIPWTMVLGNHDSEFYNLYDNDELRDIFKQGEDDLLLEPTIIKGNSDKTDQAIMLYNGDKINTSLLFMDSESLIENSEVSINWYEKIIDKINEENEQIVPSMLFMHYPLYEYSKAYELYEQNSKEVEYFYGEKRENVCYEEKTNLFQKILEKGSTKAVFVGHDHLNDFSLTYKGVRLTYGKSIDYITYFGIGNRKEQRGATLITIKYDASFVIDPIKLTDIEK